MSAYEDPYDLDGLDGLDEVEERIEEALLSNADSLDLSGLGLETLPRN
ncbi:hypothetical protein [Streptomyces chattanoogensis]|nr:hypothetical protein [Streptomyces chattanoogensis]